MPTFYVWSKCFYWVNVCPLISGCQCSADQGTERGDRQTEDHAAQLWNGTATFYCLSTALTLLKNEWVNNIEHHKRLNRRLNTALNNFSGLTGGLFLPSLLAAAQSKSIPEWWEGWKPVRHHATEWIKGTARSTATDTVVFWHIKAVFFIFNSMSFSFLTEKEIKAPCNEPHPLLTGRFVMTCWLRNGVKITTLVKNS